MFESQGYQTISAYHQNISPHTLDKQWNPLVTHHLKKGHPQSGTPLH